MDGCTSPVDAHSSLDLLFDPAIYIYFVSLEAFLLALVLHHLIGYFSVALNWGMLLMLFFASPTVFLLVILYSFEVTSGCIR